MESTPLALRAYRSITVALSPFAPMLLKRRALRGKEEAARIGERFGRASLPRPAGQLIWIHGASVGECVAVLPLIESLSETQDRSVLMTSGTVTSAKLLAGRLPRRALHQYAPLDIPSAVARFLDYWRPEAALFVDSEIWPNVLLAARGRGVNLALINGRISKRSFHGWLRAPRTAARIFSLYDVCLAQDNESAERLRSLGAHNVQVSGGLKADAPPLPVDDADLARLSAAVAGRPLLLAASTHPGEEDVILAAHDDLRQRHPDLLTIIVPRHPERGEQIARLCGARSFIRRTQHNEPLRDTRIYIADTIGELGLFYRLAPFAFMGGSLIAHGGQNPLEAARLSCAVMSGPYTENFAQAYEAIFAAQGTGLVRTTSEIVAFAERALSSPGERQRLGATAARAADSLGGALAKTRDTVEAMLSHASA